MTKPELGAKRICVHCGAKFYDLHQSPVTCPKCDKVFEPTQVSSRLRPGAAPVTKVKPTDESQKPALLASEDAGREKAEVEIDDESLDDAAFVEERENTDVTEIIGDDTKKGT
jgi:uncharacterized protein (TIGR02300 family)